MVFVTVMESWPAEGEAEKRRLKAIPRPDQRHPPGMTTSRKHREETWQEARSRCRFWGEQGTRKLESDWTELTLRLTVAVWTWGSDFASLTTVAHQNKHLTLSYCTWLWATAIIQMNLLVGIEASVSHLQETSASLLFNLPLFFPF